MPTLRFVIVVLGLGYLGGISLSCHYAYPPTVLQRPYVSDRIPRPHQISAQVYYLDELRKKYAGQLQKRKVDLTKVETRVYWSRATCPSGRVGLIYDPPPVKDKDGKVVLDKPPGCYGGLTWNCKEIVVADYDGPISESAFIHELGHCYYRGIYGKRDSEHGDKDFWGHVSKVNSALAERGW